MPIAAIKAASEILAAMPPVVSWAATVICTALQGDIHHKSSVLILSLPKKPLRRGMMTI